MAKLLHFSYRCQRLRHKRSISSHTIPFVPPNPSSYHTVQIERCFFYTPIRHDH
jgi:hypothetical protein